MMAGEGGAGMQMESGAAIIRKRQGRLDIEIFPDILVRHTGMMRLDATKLCSDGPGILLAGAAPEMAQAVADALNQHGEECFVVSAEKIVSAPDATPIHSARLTNKAFRPADAAGNEFYAEWKDASVLGLAGVKLTKSQRESDPQSFLTRRAPHVGIGGGAGLGIGDSLSSGRSKTSEETRTETWLDILFRDPLRRYRIVAPRFDYQILGERLQGNDQANIVTLARWLVHQARHMRTNFDADELIRTGEMDIPAMSRIQFHDTIDWLLNLARLEADD